MKLSDEEEGVRRLALPELSPRKVLQVLSIGSWITADVGEQFIESGKHVEAAWLIIRGKVRVTQGERLLGDLVPGQIVGSTLTFTGVPPVIDASAAEPVRAVRWEIGTLESSDEQRGAIFGGAWGEKGADQGEHRSVQHQPDTVRGMSVPTDGAVR